MTAERAALERLTKAARDPRLIDMLTRLPAVDDDGELDGLEELRDALIQADAVLRDQQPNLPEPEDPS